MSEPALQLRCPGCNRVLGRCANDLFVIKHHGRTVVAERVLAIRCEDCQATWQPPAVAEAPTCAP